MEYFENGDLEQVARKLNHLEVGNCYLTVKLDAFTSSYQKRAARSRKTIKQEGAIPELPEAPYLRSGIVDLDDQDAALPGAPEKQRSTSWGADYRRRPQRRRTSSLGDLSEPSSRSLFLDMVGALNAAFPDYDFADSTLAQFKDMSLGGAVQQINGALAELTLRQPLILEQLWAAIDSGAGGLQHCEVFGFQPSDSDGEDEFLWRFHHFFFNKALRRLLYFTAGAKSLLRKRGDAYSSDEDEDEDMAQEDMEGEPMDLDSSSSHSDSSDSEEEEITMRGEHMHHHYHHHHHHQLQRRREGGEQGEAAAAADSGEEEGEDGGDLPDYDGII